MKKLFIVCSILCISIIAYNQSSTGPVEMKKTFLGTTFIQGGNNLKMKDLLIVTQNNPEAYKMVKKARSNSTVASIFGGAGGFLIGYPIGTSIGGGKPNWAMAGVGAGMIALAVPFSISAMKNVKKAVAIHNQKLNTTTTSRISMSTGFTSNGIGFIVAF